MRPTFLWLLALGSLGCLPSAPATTTTTTTSPTTTTTPTSSSTSSTVTVPCADEAPENGTAHIVDVVVAAGAPVPACEWTCNWGYVARAEDCEALEPICVDGWCFEHPLPSGFPVEAIGAISADEVVMSTDAYGMGPVWWDGVRWGADGRPLAPERPRDLLVRASGDVWAAAEAGLWHFDGTTWTEDSPLPGARHLVVAEVDGRLWAVASVNTVSEVYEQVVGTWELRGSLPGSAAGLVGRASDDVAVLVHDATHLWDGTTWTRRDVPGAAPAAGLALHDDEYVIASDEAVHFVEPKGWRTEAIGGPARGLVSADGELWVASDPLRRRAGGAWEPVGDDSFRAVEVAAGLDGSIWVGGGAGELGLVDGDIVVPTTQQVSRADLVAGASSAPDSAWFVGDDGSMLVRTPEGWRAELLPDGALATDVHVDEAGDVWVLADTGLFAFTSSGWSEHSPPNGAEVLVGGSGPALVASGTDLFRWNGTDWELAATAPGAIHAGWTGAEDDALIVDEDGAVHWFDGSGLTVVGQFRGSRPEIAGSGPDNVWLADTWSGVYRWNGAVLEEMSDPDDFVHSMAVVGPDEVWLATNYSGLLRADGAFEREQVFLPISSSYVTLVTVGSELWIGDRDGQVFRPE